jgi:hypothetical protein
MIFPSGPAASQSRQPRAQRVRSSAMAGDHHGPARQSALGPGVATRLGIVDAVAPLQPYPRPA